MSEKEHDAPMVTHPDVLLDRLEAIGASLSTRDSARGLLGLGSAGVERARLDRFSDLDFFVIVAAGHKAAYLDDLDWLTSVAPVAFYFRNTRDGYKLLYRDGVFCEFAVFEESELQQAAFAPGHIVWKAADFDAAMTVPREQHPSEPPSPGFLIGEALTTLYVGLLRDHRGERLSATRFIQGHAVDRILELFAFSTPSTGAYPDRFDITRRYEQRYPLVADVLPHLLPGYGRNHEAARAAISLLDDHFDIDDGMKQAVLDLCDPSPAPTKEPDDER